MPKINFENKKLDFGEPNKFYNLFSDTNIQINAHVNQNNSIDQLGFQIENYPTTYVKFDQKIYVDDYPLYTKKFLPNGSIQPKCKFEANNFNIDSLANIRNFNSTTLIQIPGYSFYIIQSKPITYNLICTFHNTSLNPSGLFGQTFSNIFENQKKYEVTSLWANNFILNKFKKYNPKIL